MCSQMSVRVEMLGRTNVCVSSRDFRKIMRAFWDNMRLGNCGVSVRVIFALRRGEGVRSGGKIDGRGGVERKFTRGNSAAIIPLVERDNGQSGAEGGGSAVSAFGRDSGTYCTCLSGAPRGNIRACAGFTPTTDVHRRIAARSKASFIYFFAHLLKLCLVCVSHPHHPCRPPPVAKPVHGSYRVYTEHNADTAHPLGRKNK